MERCISSLSDVIEQECGVRLSIGVGSHIEAAIVERAALPMIIASAWWATAATSPAAWKARPENWVHRAG